MLELYHSTYSTCSQKVRLALFEKELPWTSHELALDKGEHLDPSYVRINPNAVVPTLVHDGRAIIESSVIVEYLDDVFTTNRLAPDDPFERADLRAWMRYIDEVPTTYIRYPSIHAVGLASGQIGQLKKGSPVRKGIYAQLDNGGFSKAQLETAFDALKQTVERINRAVSISRSWIMGNRLTLTDITVAPTIDRMQDLGMDSLWANRPAFQNWWSRFQSRPAFSATFTDGARLSDRFKNFESRAREVLQEIISQYED